MVVAWTIVQVGKMKKKKTSKIINKALLLYFSGRAFEFCTAIIHKLVKNIAIS